nr:reverse transcriptase domain-containing protein [Tanacetum cinerariifolium]
MYWLGMKQTEAVEIAMIAMILEVAEEGQSMLLWFEKMEYVFHISNCIIACQIKFATCTLLGSALTWWNFHIKKVGHDAAYEMLWKIVKKMMTAKYCPRSEIKKLEIEIWNLKVKGTDIAKVTRKPDKNEHENEKEYGYCKNHKKRAKTGQKRTRERKEYTRSGILSSKVKQSQLWSTHCLHTRNSYFSNNSSVTIPRRQNKRRAPNVVEPELRTIIEVAPMADNRTMEELPQAPMEGYGEAIVIPKINADHFEIKTNLLQMEMLRAFPHHGFTELTQNDTFYNGLNENDQDSLNAAAGGNLLSKTTREALPVIENKSKVRYSRNKPNVSRMNTNSSDFFQNQASTSGTLSSNTISNPKGEMKAITTHSGVAYEGPSIPTNPSPKKVVKRETEEITDKEQTNFQGSTAHIQPLVVPISEPDVSKTLPKPNIPYPSRLNDQKLREKATNQMEKFFQIFQDLHFDINFVDALLLMPKFASTVKSLLANKDKMFELAKILLN